MTEPSMLPSEFSDLEPFAAVWALASVEQRYRRRLASTMEEMHAFYDAIVPRGEAAIVYLEQFHLDDMPGPALNLFYMLCSLSAVSFAVDIFKQPKVPDSGAAYLDWVLEPSP